MKHNDIILTGLPRSGTTLTCYLLNKIENTVALNEPLEMNFSNQCLENECCKKISSFFYSNRQTLLQHKKVLSKHVDGRIQDNNFSSECNVNGLRKNVENRGYIFVEKKLTDDFILCIKHNGFFTFLLESLINHFPCYAIIRNPLAILASWNSVDFPANNGHIPVAEKLDRNLATTLQTIPDKVDRQLYILSWFFGHYKKWIPETNIIRYEDVILSGGASLKIAVPAAETLSEPLESKNKNELYDMKLMKELGERLLNSEGSFWDFYSKKSVEDLLI